MSLIQKGDILPMWTRGLGAAFIRGYQRLHFPSALRGHPNANHVAVCVDDHGNLHDVTLERGTWVHPWTDYAVAILEGTVRIWVYRPRLSRWRIDAGVEALLEEYPDGTPYDTLELMTGGLINRRGLPICSRAVGCFEENAFKKPVPHLAWNRPDAPVQFITPAHCYLARSTSSGRWLWRVGQIVPVQKGVGLMGWTIETVGGEIHLNGENRKAEDHAVRNSTLSG